jgi:hypothetical protein
MTLQRVPHIPQTWNKIIKLPPELNDIKKKSKIGDNWFSTGNLKINTLLLSLLLLLSIYELRAQFNLSD